MFVVFVFVCFFFSSRRRHTRCALVTGVQTCALPIFDMGQYAHGNQPIQHMPYLYNWAGAPWKTQHHVRDIMAKLYSSAPDGYPGDEDNGQTSAWYVFSALDRKSTRLNSSH